MAKGDAKVGIQGKDNTGKAFASAQSNLRNLASSAAVLEGPLGKFAGRINAIGAAIGRMNPLTLSAGVGISALAVAVKTATSEAADYEQAMFKVNAMLEATGHISGLTADEIAKMSRTLGDATLTNEKEALSAAAALLRFTNVQNEFFERTLKAGQDAAAVFGGGLLQNITKIGRALDNPRRGLEVLERNLITVSAEWKENVIAMFEAGQEAEAQEEIFKKLANTLGTGEGEANEGMRGALDSMGESWTVLLRNLSQHEAVTEAALAVGKLLKAAGERFDSTPLGKYNELIREQESDLRKLAIESESYFKFDLARLVASVNQRQLVIEQQHLILKGIEDEERAKKAVAKAKQAAAEIDKDTARFFKNNRITFLADEKAALKADLAKLRSSEKLRRAAEAVWRASLPPLDKLRAEYQKDAENLALAIGDKNTSLEDAERFRQGIIERGVRFDEDRRKLSVKTAKEPSRAGQIREQLLGQLNQEEEAIDASFSRRALIIADASAKLGDDQIGKQLELQNTAMLLAEDHEQAMLELRVTKALQYSDSLTSIMDSLGSFFSQRSRRITDSVNKEFSERADAIKDSIRSGVLSQKQGDSQLAALENQRQQQLDKTARKEFERGKKLSRAAAVLNTAAAMTAVMAFQPGDLSARLFAAAAIGLAGGLQVAQINATQYEGGGSISTSGLSAPSQAIQQVDQGTQQNANIVIVGNASQTFTLDQVVGLIDSIREVSGRLDLTVVDPSSRNASDIRNSANELVI